jgi:hypothetical protein
LPTADQIAKLARIQHENRNGRGWKIPEFIWHAAWRQSESSQYNPDSFVARPSLTA